MTKAYGNGVSNKTVTTVDCLAIVDRPVSWYIAGFMENFFQLSVEERRRELLRALGRERLQTLCGRHSLVVSDGRKLDSYIDAITQAGVPLFEALSIFSRDELKAICRAIGLSDIGTEKVVLAKRISRSISTRGIAPTDEAGEEKSEENIKTEEPQETGEEQRAKKSEEKIKAEVPEKIETDSDLPSPGKIIGDFFKKPSIASLRDMGLHEEIVPTETNRQIVRNEPPPKQDKLIPTFRSLRRLLDAALRTDADLDAFILDNFYEIKKRITAGMERKAKINLLFECVDPINLLGNLLMEHPDIEKTSGIPIEYVK